MIEANAFLAVFTLQILVLSVLHPARFIRYVREKATSFPVERFAQLFPGVDRSQSVERFVTLYRVACAIIAVLGVLLLSWLFNDTRRADWDAGTVVGLHCVYSMIQHLPIVLVAWLGFRFNQVHRHSLLDAKRKATLQRRGLLDFISPFIVFLAVAGYFLLVTLVIYFQRKPFPGFALIGVLTLVYAAQAFVVYRSLYGKKSNPIETHAHRVHTIGMTVKVTVYGCIVCTVFFAFIFTVDLLDLKRWVPLAQSVCLVINAFLCLMTLTAPPREPEVDGLGSSPVP